MQDFDWKLLVSLYNTKNITKCAEMLYLSQPALTKRIRSIENELGCHIIIRSHTGVEFTQEGEQIVRRAKQIVAVIEDMNKDILQFQSGATGTISLGVPYSYVRFVLPSLLAAFAKEFPDIIVNITSDMSDKLVEQTLNHSLDVSFARCAVEDDTLEKILVGEDQVYAVYDRPFSLEQLPELPFIEYKKNAKTMAESRKWWAANYQVPQKTRMFVPNGDACVSMILQGLGYGIFFDQSYYQQEKSLYTIPLPAVDGNGFIRKTWLIYPKSQQKNPSVDCFLKIAKEFFHSKEL